MVGKFYEAYELSEVIRLHVLYLTDSEDGKRADLRGADLRGADLEGANLRGATLVNANLVNATLVNANLRGANLRGANLRGANLGGANLWEANLGDANLGDAVLGGANLEDANLRGANLRGAYLKGAYLTGANMHGRVPLYADTRRRYVLYVIEGTLGGPRFVAGCRNYSLTEALAHWGPWGRYQPGYVEAITRWCADNGVDTSTPDNNEA